MSGFQMNPQFLKRRYLKGKFNEVKDITVLCRKSLSNTQSYLKYMHVYLYLNHTNSLTNKSPQVNTYRWYSPIVLRNLGTDPKYVKSTHEITNI